MCCREFIQMHLRLLTAEKLLCPSYASNETFLSIGAENDKYDVSMLHFNSDYKVSLEDSCNGLVCLSLDGLSQIILWNPTTRKHKVIGLPDHSSSSDSLPYIGLGFAPEIDDYKILWIPSPIMRTPDDDEITVWVYSLRSDSWKMVEVLPYACLLWPPTSINGCMHWITSNQTTEDRIIAIDLYSDCLQGLDLPFSFHCSIDNFIALAVINGSLSTVISLEVESRSRHYEVWIMTKYGVQDSWTKNFVVGPFSTFTRPVGSWKDRKLLFLDLVEEDILLSYDVFTSVVDFQYSGFNCLPPLNYIESFESVNGRRRLAPETAVS
ncbi:hypothetical protein Pfo_000603 [Paulownia fortunei]|nr:hypothetical protein Pfo_000603 [Paulownia fortunei]